ncbi:unnamed protein product [Urochloa decumbens]|uniref:KIB1-4 beta-propeller domain-containing protein n=1 Tax=Urochloa decumbens TaxID=240449 RepID=A0ABC9ANG5_9POAL
MEGKMRSSSRASAAATAPRLRPAAMDSGRSTSADQNRRAPLPAPVRNSAKPSRSRAAAAQTRRSTKCATASETPRSDEAQHRPWADVPVDILGVVFRLLSLVQDRARLRSVCGVWRAAARPLPLLVMSDFSFAGFCADGTLSCMRPSIPLPERETRAAGSFRCVGSFEGWLVGVGMKLNKGRYSGDLLCSLINPFSRVVIRLPPPSAATLLPYACSRSLPVVDGSGVVNCAIKARQCVMSFRKVILSSSPNSGSKCVVAAISVVNSEAKLALWRSGMKLWCVCDGECITRFTDIIFCQGNLYLLTIGEFTAKLFVFEISKDDDRLLVSHVECREIEGPNKIKGCRMETCTIAEWRGKLLMVVTYSGDAEVWVWQRITGVRVFEVDLSTNPVRFIDIHSLDGDCICFSSCRSKSFRSCDYDGVEDNLIYCTRPFDSFVYNMKDGTMAPFATRLPGDKLCKPGILMNLTWLFPPK